MTEDTGESKEFCESCHVGALQPFRATYARWHEGEFVIVPGVAAWRCDCCSDTFFDEEALTRLVLLLGPESDLEDQRRRRGRGLGGVPGADLGDRRRAG